MGSFEEEKEEEEDNNSNNFREIVDVFLVARDIQSLR